MYDDVETWVGFLQTCKCTHTHTIQTLVTFKTALNDEIYCYKLTFDLFTEYFLIECEMYKKKLKLKCVFVCVYISGRRIVINYLCFCVVHWCTIHIWVIKEGVKWEVTLSS